MKILILILLLPAMVHSQTMAQKTHTDSTGKYLIEYCYDAENCISPAVSNSECHYPATIQVYKIILRNKSKHDTIAVGKAFGGMYVQNGCFEDSPAGWVKKAIARRG